MYSPYFLQNFFIAIILFSLVGGYVLTALILAPFGRTIHLKIVGFFMALLAADYFYSEGKNWIRGADFRQSFKNATVYVADRGPIEFERIRRNRLVETSFGTESGLHKIGFEVEGAVEDPRDRTQSYRICPASPRSDGLAEVYGGRGRSRCPNSRPGGVRMFISVEGADPPVQLRCRTIDGRHQNPNDAAFCAMQFDYGHYVMRIAMWETPRSLWRQARDHMIAILDQSYKIEFKKPSKG